MYCSLLLYCTPLHTTYCTTFRHWQTDVSAHDGRERRHQEGSPVACVLPDAETCRLSAHPPACVRSSCGRMPRGCRSSWKWRWPLASVHRVLPTLRQCTSGRAPSAGGGGGPSRERVCAAGSAVNADQPPLALRSVKSGRSRTRQTPTEGAAPHWFTGSACQDAAWYRRWHQSCFTYLVEYNTSIGISTQVKKSKRQKSYSIQYPCILDLLEWCT